MRRRWTWFADHADRLDPQTLGRLRGAARVLRRQLDRLIRTADFRLSMPIAGSEATSADRASGIDWRWRPAVWQGALEQSGAARSAGGAAVASGSQICEAVTLFHDCPLAEIAYRQLRNPAAVFADPRGGAPFALAIEVFGFRGSFLSLALDLPPQAAEGLRRKHVIRLDTVIEAERPVSILARLNIRHGPNVEQVGGQVTGSGADGLGADSSMIEFDLAYSEIHEERVEQMWIDLFVQAPQMNCITLRDMALCRRPRAAL